MKNCNSFFHSLERITYMSSNGHHSIEDFFKKLRLKFILKEFFQSFRSFFESFYFITCNVSNMNKMNCELIKNGHLKFLLNDFWRVGTRSFILWNELLTRVLTDIIQLKKSSPEIYFGGIFQSLRSFFASFYFITYNVSNMNKMNCELIKNDHLKFLLGDFWRVGIRSFSHWNALLTRILTDIIRFKNSSKNIILNFFWMIFQEFRIVLWLVLFHYFQHF